MSRGRRAARWLVVVGLITAVSAAASDKGWVWLHGKAITQAFANRDFGDGVHFAYQFLEDGELRGMNMGKSSQGSWRAVGDELCWHWAKSKEPEECYRVRRNGQAIRLFLDGQEVLAGDLEAR